MKKITQNFYQAKNKSTNKVLFGLFALTLMSTQVSLGQQATGQFPVVDGSFETGTFTELTSQTVAPGAQLVNWGFHTATTNPILALTTANSRTGTKSLNWGASGSSARIFTPTFPAAAVLPNTSYVIQFYYWKNNTGNARGIQAVITADGIANVGAEVSTPNLGTSGVASTVWTKATIVVSSLAGSQYGLVRLRANGGAFSTYYLDDLVIYEGAAEDVTAPDAVTSANGVVSGAGVDVSWTAPGAGVDGGGYLVVRYDVAPNADNDPSTNGIYSVGNTINNGTDALVGTVVYTGVGESFTDAAGVAGSFYKVYTVDKAFNYSNEVEPTLGLNDVSFGENAVSVYKNNGVININAGNVVIANIKVYDVQGKLLAEQNNVNATTTVVKELKAAEQVLVVKVTSEDGKVVTKKVVN